MGKKYLDTKKDSLESSVLGVWKTAIEEGEAIRDNAKMTKKEVEVDEIVGALARVGGAVAKGVKTAGQVAAVGIKKGGKALKKKIHKATADEFNPALDEKQHTHVDPKDRDELDKKPDARGGAETAKKMKRAKEPEPGQMAEAQSGDKEAYKKFFNAALKKFKVNSPAELKGDNKKKFYDYIDANWEGDNEKAEAAMSQVREFKVQSMKAALAKVWGIDEHKGDKPHKHPHEEDVELGELEDSSRVRKLKQADLKKKREHEYKMKYGPQKENEKEMVKNGKTATGKKAAVIDLKPKIKD